MKFNIEKIKEEEYETFDSNTESPWLTFSPFIHSEQQGNNTWKKQQQQQQTTTGCDKKESIPRMKQQQQQQQQQDVTRLLLNHTTSNSSISSSSISSIKSYSSLGSHSNRVGNNSSNSGDLRCSSPCSSSSSSSSSICTFLIPTMLNNNNHEFYDTRNLGKESILMKKALNQEKRRESIGDISRKRPIVSTSNIIPRLTKSSIISTITEQQRTSEECTSQQRSSQQQQYHNKRRHSTTTRKKSRHQKQQQQQQQQQLLLLQQQQRETTTGVTHWDPHIDAFEILRAKITGITRSMQEFHVEQLFYNDDDEKRKKKKLTPSTSSPLITSSSSSSSCCDNKMIRSSSSCLATSTFHNVDDEQDEEEKLTTPMKSPNLTALFKTTNNLIHSRLDELSETTTNEWQNKFLGLVTSCIHQSEELESLSTNVLNTEHKVRELMVINNTIHDQFNQREKQYEERIKECQHVAKQQLLLIESLEELTADINMKMNSQQVKALVAKQNEEEEEEEEEDRWNFQKSIADLLHMNDKHDLIQKMRWDIGMFVGGGVGTGHVIHSFQNELNGIDMMIAGTGTTATTTTTISESYYSISPSIQHIKLYQHQYILHLNSRDRKTRFALLPKRLWIKDDETDACQFQHCSTQFTFFKRKHHCRKCGYIMCQRHSANRLPLFSTSIGGQWSRVCDDCFHDLITQ